MQPLLDPICQTAHDFIPATRRLGLKVLSINSSLVYWLSDQVTLDSQVWHLLGQATCFPPVVQKRFWRWMSNSAVRREKRIQTVQWNITMLLGSFYHFSLTSVRVCSIPPWACFCDHTHLLFQDKISESRNHKTLVTLLLSVAWHSLFCCNWTRAHWPEQKSLIKIYTVIIMSTNL